MPGKNRQKQKETKRARKQREMQHPSGESKYGRKARFLNANGGSGLDYPEKPWRS